MAPFLPLSDVVWMMHYRVTLRRFSVLEPSPLVRLSRCGELPHRACQSCFFSRPRGLSVPPFLSSLEVLSHSSFFSLRKSCRGAQYHCLFDRPSQDFPDALTPHKVAYPNSSHSSEPLNTSRTTTGCWKRISDSGAGYMVCGTEPSSATSAGFLTLPNFFYSSTLQNYLQIIM